MKNLFELGRGRASTRGARSGGFTLIELAIATSILMIGIVGVISATSQMHSLRKSNRERVIAQNGLRSMAERVHASSHGFTDDLGTWSRDLLLVWGPGGSMGNTFVVPGLDSPAPGSPHGTLEFVLDETATDDDLGAELGMPRDLNGDGDATDTDVQGEARLLPVIMTLRWRGENGQSVMRHAFYLMGY